MKKAQRLTATEQLLIQRGCDPDSAAGVASAAEKRGEPLLESLCFVSLAERNLLPIHSAAWVRHRAKDAGCPDHAVINRMLAAGVSAKDVALFARMVQREYQAFFCLLDGTGVPDAADLPFTDFRVVCVDEYGNPTQVLSGLHENVGWTDTKTETKLSREAAESSGW